VDYLVPFITGSVVGMLFAGVGAYVPAPPNLQGVLGVVGITVGYMLISTIKR